MDNRIYYKVCLENDGRYLSSWETAYPVEYRIGYTTVPNRFVPNSKLFIFSEFKFAKDYALTHFSPLKKLVIFECTATDVEELEYVPEGHCRFSFWVERKIQDYFKIEGTMIASSLKLISKIDCSFLEI